MKKLDERVRSIIYGFKGEYHKAVNQYREIANSGDYTQSYKDKKKAEILDKLIEQRAEVYKKALEEVEKDRRERDKPKKELSVEEKLLQATERNNLIQMTGLRVKGAKPYALNNILAESENNEDVKNIIISELRGRENLNFEEKSLLEELNIKRPQDDIEVAETNIKFYMGNEDNFYLSYGETRSLKKDFDLETSNYFKNTEEASNYFNR